MFALASHIFLLCQRLEVKKLVVICVAYFAVCRNQSSPEKGGILRLSIVVSSANAHERYRFLDKALYTVH